MRELWEKYRDTALYLIFGAVTTAVNVVTYHVCFAMLGVPNTPSVVIAWVLSVAVAYITNKLWVFRSSSFAPAVLWPELGKFVAARAFTGVLDLGIMFVGVDLLGLQEGGPATALKLGSNVLVVVLNYVFSKWLIFKDQAGEE